MLMAIHTHKNSPYIIYLAAVIYNPKNSHFRVLQPRASKLHLRCVIRASGYTRCIKNVSILKKLADFLYCAPVLVYNLTLCSNNVGGGGAAPTQEDNPCPEPNV